MFAHPKFTVNVNSPYSSIRQWPFRMGDGDFIKRLEGLSKAFCPSTNNHARKQEEEENMRLWRDGSALKLTCCSSTWPKFSSQHPHWRLTTACSSSSRVLESSSGFDGHTTTNLYIHMYIKNKNKQRMDLTRHQT